MARVTILMATYNGERFLSDQLNSFDCQTFSDWDLWVSDDGSSDNTKNILDNFQRAQEGRHFVRIMNGPQKGFVSNFLNLTLNCSSQSEYFSFSDQDDIWFDDKLQKAVEWLETIPEDVPALYCSRTEIVGEDARSACPAVYSPLMTIGPSFSNALVQSIAGGNTMVFNRSAKQLFKDFGGDVDVPSHDWWLYLLVTGVGGKVFYDSEPSLCYRQHRRNVVGSNNSVVAMYSRFVKFLDGQFKRYNEKNVYCLDENKSKLTPDNRLRLENFRLARANHGIKGLKYFRQSGALRNGFMFNLALYLGVLTGRI